MLLTRDEETIIAQCTPSGSGAIAVIRLSGTDALTIAEKIAQFTNNKKLTKTASHTIHLGWVVDQQGAHIDQVLFFVMKTPKSYTGQDTIEISCHNNQFIIEAIIQQAIRCGARTAQHGEFTKRAYLNKKIDLIQAESVNELIQAHTQQALKKSLAQLSGSFSYWIHDLEQQLIKAHSLCEASFEFIDEDINFDTTIKNIIQVSLEQVQQLQQQYSHQQQVKEGIRIAIIGAVNAGKSSLFNALLKKERAIVTPHAGTTRDTIEASICRNNLYFTLVDTAGFRSTQNTIEQEGIKRALYEAKAADIVLLSVDSSRILNKNEKQWYQQLVDQCGSKIIIVATKSDVGTAKLDFANSLAVSATTGHQLNLLEQVLIQRANSLFATSNCPFLLNKRQAQLLGQLENDLNALNQMADKSIEYELLCVHLKDALEKTTELTGKTISELSLDKIFQDFCIGK